MLFNCYHLPVSLQRLMGERRFARYVYRISSGYRLLFSQACITEFYDLLSGWSWGSQRTLLGRQILCSIAPGATRKIHHIDCHCRLKRPKLPALVGFLGGSIFKLSFGMMIAIVAALYPLVSQTVSDGLIVLHHSSVIRLCKIYHVLPLLTNVWIQCAVRWAILPIKKELYLVLDIGFYPWFWSPHLGDKSGDC
jgi:hypothetical protein